MLLLLALLVCILPLAKGEFDVTLNQTDVKFLRNSTQNADLTVTNFAAIDEKNNLIYSAGKRMVNILRYNENMELEVMFSGAYTTSNKKFIASMQVCDGFMSAVINQVNTTTMQVETKLVIFSPFNESLNYVFQPIKTILLSGKFIRHHVITRDCKKYIIAMKGTVGIITFAENDGLDYQGAFEEKYIPIGVINNLDKVKRTYFLDHEMSQYLLSRISINTDETRAYVTSGRNNAIVTIDLLQGIIIDITGMGAKDWSEDGGTHGLDCSTDGVINITNIPLLTFYQPADIQSVRLGNDDILFTGNNGYEHGMIKVVDVTFEKSSSHLQDVANACPGLFIRSYDILNDADDNKKMNKVLGYGGRGMSLFNATDSQVIADTKSAVEESVREIHPQWFNVYFSMSSSEKPIYDFNSNTGPFIHRIVAAFVCNNQRLVTIAGGNMLYVFTVDVNHIDQGFQFHGLYDGLANQSSNSTFRQLYDDRLVSLKEISNLRIVEVAPEKLMLVASGALTGTINVFEILVTDCPTNDEINIKEDGDDGPRRCRKNKNKKKSSKKSSSSEDDDDRSSKRSSKRKRRGRILRKAEARRTSPISPPPQMHA